MAWETGARYRGRGVRNEFHITKNVNGTTYVEGFVEVTLGPMTGQRLRYRGYLNTDKNRETTAGELRAMGWKGERWNDLGGIGGKEFNFVCLGDQVRDDQGNEKTYLRAGFVRELETLDRRKALSNDEVDKLPPPPSKASAVVNGHAALPVQGGSDPLPVQESDIPF